MSLRTKLDMKQQRQSDGYILLSQAPPKKDLIIEDSSPSSDSSESKDDDKVPPLPLLPPPEQCDWCISSTGCLAPELPLQNCQKETCHHKVHHLCQNQWHESVGYESTTIAKYCHHHDDGYINKFANPTEVTDGYTPKVVRQNANGDIFFSSSSEEEEEEKATNANVAAAKNNAADDETDDVADTTAKNEDIDSDNKVDDDEYDSGDSRSEAELVVMIIIFFVKREKCQNTVTESIVTQSLAG